MIEKNPITKAEQIFSKFSENFVKLGFKPRAIKNTIENKALCGGSVWQCCQKNLKIQFLMYF